MQTKSAMSPVSGRDGLELRINAREARYICWIVKLTVRQQREYDRHVSAIVDAFKVGASSEPCQQLRSTRRTELERLFPSHVVNEWMCHSSAVAERHYLQITAEDLERAANLETIEGALRTAACTAEPHSTEAHRAEQKAKKPGKPTISKAQLDLQRPQQDSNIGRFDPIKTRVGTVLEGSRTAARTAELGKSPRVLCGGVAAERQTAVEHLSDAAAKMLTLFGCLTVDQQRHALEWLGELAGVVVEVVGDGGGGRLG